MRRRRRGRRRRRKRRRRRRMTDALPDCVIDFSPNMSLSDCK